MYVYILLYNTQICNSFFTKTLKKSEEVYGFLLKWPVHGVCAAFFPPSCTGSISRDFKILSNCIKASGCVRTKQRGFPRGFPPCSVNLHKHPIRGNALRTNPPRKRHKKRQSSTAAEAGEHQINCLSVIYCQLYHRNFKSQALHGFRPFFPVHRPTNVIQWSRRVPASASRVQTQNRRAAAKGRAARGI